ACTRALRSPHGVSTGAAISSAPAAIRRRATSVLSGTSKARRTVPDTRRPASTESIYAACAPSNNSSVLGETEVIDVVEEPDSVEGFSETVELVYLARGKLLAGMAVVG